MTKKEKTVVVGKLTKSFCKKYGIKHGIDFEIVQSLGLIYHTQKHLNNFANVQFYSDSLANISQVFSAPYHVIYDDSRKSIKFYKKISQYICVVVNILENYAYVSTIYPISKKAIDKMKNKRIK